MHQLVLLNMNGTNTIGDIYEGLSPDWEDLTPEGLVALVNNLQVRGWIKEEQTG